MWNQQIKYWLAANGRHYRMVAKISSVYESMYMGFPLPYGLPTQFPYPLVVGGAACPTTTAAYNRYSSTQADHRAFPNPYADDAEICTASIFDTTDDYGTLKILQGTNWVKFYGIINSVWPYYSGPNSSYGYDYYYPFRRLLRENIDGSRPLFPAVPMMSSPVKNIVGELQGIFAVPAFGGMAAEDPITIGSDTYIAFPIVPNADRGDFFAFKLE